MNQMPALAHRGPTFRIQDRRRNELDQPRRRRKRQTQSHRPQSLCCSFLLLLHFGCIEPIVHDDHHPLRAHIFDISCPFPPSRQCGRPSHRLSQTVRQQPSRGPLELRAYQSKLVNGTLLGYWRMYTYKLLLNNAKKNNL